jgi:hypothetical protein
MPSDAPTAALSSGYRQHTIPYLDLGQLYAGGDLELEHLWLSRARKLSAMNNEQ